MALLTLFGDALGSLPLALRALVLSGVLVVLMANVVMPLSNIAVTRCRRVTRAASRERTVSSRKSDIERSYRQRSRGGRVYQTGWQSQTGSRARRLVITTIREEHCRGEHLVALDRKESVLDPIPLGRDPGTRRAM